MLVSWSLFVSCILYLRLPKFQLSPAPKEALDLFEKEFFLLLSSSPGQKVLTAANPIQEPASAGWREA